jgi:hypothetical protein
MRWRLWSRVGDPAVALLALFTDNIDGELHIQIFVNMEMFPTHDTCVNADSKPVNRFSKPIC